MNIPFSEISSSGSSYSLENLHAPPEDSGLVLHGPAGFSCSLVRQRENRVVLQGKVHAEVELRCDRCGIAYDFPVRSIMQIIYEVPAPEHWRIKDLDRVVADLDVIELIEPVIDLEAAAWEQVSLALPVKQICHKGCRGVCPQCGTDLNQHGCDCRPEGRSNPFAVLAQLKTGK